MRVDKISCTIRSEPIDAPRGDAKHLREHAIQLQIAKALIYLMVGTKIAPLAMVAFAFHEKIATANVDELWHFVRHIVCTTATRRC